VTEVVVVAAAAVVVVVVVVVVAVLVAVAVAEVVVVVVFFLSEHEAIVATSPMQRAATSTNWSLAGNSASRLRIADTMSTCSIITMVGT
jgi:hypothetical protein